MNNDKQTGVWSAITKWPKRAWKWYAGLFRGRKWYVKGLSAIATLIVAFVVYLVMVDINLLWLFGRTPSMNTVLNKRAPEASQIFSADSVLIGKFYNENRMPVEYEEVSPVFWQALVDTEDERYYTHFGIDFPAFFAALKDYIVHHDARGASTITQQLAKNLFKVRSEYSTGLLGNLPGLRILIMKTKEWITAIKLETFFSKQEILTMYANTVDFGSNAFGIKTASKTYFGISPSELSTTQAAVLVGMLKATTYYNPRLNPDNSKERRNVVLANMMHNGHLSEAEYHRLAQLPIELNYSSEKAYYGEANYFKDAVADYMKEWCEQNGYSLHDLYTEGFSIYTTIDMRMQRYAEEAARQQMMQVQKNFNSHWGNTPPWQDRQHREIPQFIENLAKRLPYYKQLEERFDGQKDSIDYYMNLPHKVELFDYEQGKIEREMSTLDSLRYMVRFMHCGFMAMEPQTGFVRAWVGDIDFDTWQYDKVTAKRQPGSTFKLFVYAEAMKQGLTPCDRRQDTYFALKSWDAGKEVVWAPSNANGYFSGANMTLKAAFARSVNSVAVKLGQELGINNIVNTAKSMGVTSKLDPTPSLALGASDVSLKELVTAYATVANNGKLSKPVMVVSIRDRDGNEIYKANNKLQNVLSYRTAFFLQQLMQGGLREAGGTSMSLWSYIRDFTDTDFGGKTGTSNNHSDAWFMGITPNLVCGAWVGGEYRAIHFRTGQLGQGARTALPICGLFLKKTLSDPKYSHYRTRFQKPKESDIPSEQYANCYTDYSIEPLDSLANDSITPATTYDSEAEPSQEE